MLIHSSRSAALKFSPARPLTILNPPSLSHGSNTPVQEDSLTSFRSQNTRRTPLRHFSKTISPCTRHTHILGSRTLANTKAATIASVEASLTLLRMAGILPLFVLPPPHQNCRGRCANLHCQYQHGSFGLSGGTSASSPIFASIVNRIVEDRMRKGKAPLGFMNPALYGFPSMLNDITNGTNPGCGTPGFKAVKGWDPVTGLGTPNYPRMLDYFMSLP